MISGINMNPKLVFIILLVITFCYARTKRFGERNFGLIITSFLQGIVLSLIFNELLLAPIWALMYYLFSLYFWNVIFMIKSALKKHEDYIDNELIQSLKNIPEFRKLKFKLKKYTGSNSLNANVLPPIPFISDSYQISLGEKLISKFTLEEKKFVLAHEVSHALKKHVLIKIFLMFLLIIVIALISIKLNVFVANKIEKYLVQFYYLITFSLFLIGIIGINLISWYIEYDADKKALQLTKDLKSLEAAFLKFDKNYLTKDYGLIINLIVYTHPLVKNRIKKAEQLTKLLQ
ncbi:M48 family metallopeptidase [Candidatus Pyrohabitans sp.]